MSSREMIFEYLLIDGWNLIKVVIIFNFLNQILSLFLKLLYISCLILDTFIICLIFHLLINLFINLFLLFSFQV